MPDHDVQFLPPHHKVANHQKTLFLKFHGKVLPFGDGDLIHEPEVLHGEDGLGLKTLGWVRRPPAKEADYKRPQFGGG